VNPVEDWLTQPGGLAERLRELRNEAKLNGKQLAEAAGWQQSKVSRIENGRQVPSEDDIRTWAALCGATPDVTGALLGLLQDIIAGRNDWRRRARHGQAAIQADYNRLVAEATVIRHFDTAAIPGLLQTPGYARVMLNQAILLGHVERDDDDLAAAVATRMQRQQALYDPAKRFEFLIGESALRWLPCSPDVMRGQLDRLQTVIGMPNVRFGVVPLGVPIPIVPQHGFVLYDDLAFVEGFVSEGVCTPEESERLAGILDLLWREGVTGEDARGLIVAAADSLPRVS
jgi:transcriptional regulator with XRE-family HTH domain